MVILFFRQDYVADFEKELSKSENYSGTIIINLDKDASKSTYCIFLKDTEYNNAVNFSKTPIQVVLFSINEKSKNEIKLIIKKNNSIDNPNNIVITQYKTGTQIQLKKIGINSGNDINELSKYVEKLKPLTSNEMVDLALAQEIDIKCNNSISIGIQLGEKNYCYYTDKEKNISSLSKMPNGLYEWVEEKIK